MLEEAEFFNDVRSAKRPRGFKAGFLLLVTQTERETRREKEKGREAPAGYYRSRESRRRAQDKTGQSLRLFGEGRKMVARKPQSIFSLEYLLQRVSLYTAIISVEI
jgi:hypothetical protein